MGEAFWVLTNSSTLRQVDSTAEWLVARASMVAPPATAAETSAVSEATTGPMGLWLVQRCPSLITKLGFEPFNQQKW